MDQGEQTFFHKTRHLRPSPTVHQTWRQIWNLVKNALFEAPTVSLNWYQIDNWTKKSSNWEQDTDFNKLLFVTIGGEKPVNQSVDQLVDH